MTMSLRTKQALAIAAGVVVAVAMMWLGLWQMSSYEESTRDVSAERAAEPPVALAESVAADGTVADVYGHRVTFSGQYEPDHQALIGDDSPYRVATAFRLDDGRHVTVVRGTVPKGEEVPAAPEGPQDVEGIFLAPDKPYDGSSTDIADYATLRVQELAQTWPSPLIAGYVTLAEGDSAAQALGQAPLELPEAEGSATHRGYALQWWVFAAGAIAFGIYAARGFAKDEAKKQARVARENETDPPEDPSGDTPSSRADQVSSAG